jgi:hypothetical protein
MRKVDTLSITQDSGQHLRAPTIQQKVRDREFLEAENPGLSQSSFGLVCSLYFLLNVSHVLDWSNMMNYEHGEWHSATHGGSSRQQMNLRQVSFFNTQ